MSDVYFECTTCGETEEGYFTDDCTPEVRFRGAVYGMPWAQWKTLDDDAKAEHVRQSSDNPELAVMLLG